MSITLEKVKMTNRRGSEEQYKKLVKRLDTGDRIDPFYYEGVFFYSVTRSLFCMDKGIYPYRGTKWN